MKIVHSKLSWVLLIPMLVVLVLLLFLILRYPSDRDSLKVYYHAGSNVLELLRTFDHFRNDPDERKFEAVKFLVKNMDQYYYMEDSYGDKKIEWYSSHFEKIFASISSTEDSLDAAWKDLRASTPTKKIRDARGITSEFLITHINQAFENWDTSRWSQHLTFEQFCEFMLPYKPWQCKPELWLPYYNEVYKPINDAFPDSTPILERLYTLWDTAEVWSRDGYINLGRKMTPVEMQTVRSGDCYYDAAWIKSIGVSLGMPISIIYLPNEANASGMHYWNAYLDENGVWRELMDRERVSIMNWSLVAPKVFLQYWGKQDNSFRSIAEKHGLRPKDIPDGLSSWTVVDITSKIIPCTNVDVEITYPNKYNSQFVYLAVIDDRIWDPVHWAYLEDGKALFSDIGHQALYMPVYFHNGASAQAGKMFILDYNGDVDYLIPDTSITFEINIDRVYPIKQYLMNNHSKDMRGSTIEGSNDSNFTNFDTLLFIIEEPKIPRESDPETKYIYTYDQWWGEQSIDHRNSYRYLRYQSGSDRPCNIGDLELYDKDNNKVVPVSLEAPGKNPEALFDGVNGEDYLFPEDGSKITMDMGQPVSLSRIRYIAHDIDPASVQTGDEYKLSVWDGKDWKEILTMEATRKAIPTKLHPGGMYLLENLSRFVHSRPFRYLPDKQVIEWW